ncbi:uncharacterized protein LOC128211112 [Mya arenaria]|uniref:uncharacterized protein LOC128211112 n=1 Tax=Mya arenaria TaxID=6604 RepID=UPI0022E641B7|nr:uncharacterized protein LOC128211112 [Mya arenaria]
MKINVYHFVWLLWLYDKDKLIAKGEVTNHVNGNDVSAVFPDEAWPRVEDAQTVNNRSLEIPEVRDNPVVSDVTAVFEEVEVRIEGRVDAFPEHSYQWRSEDGILLQAEQILQTIPVASDILPLSG